MWVNSEEILEGRYTCGTKRVAVFMAPWKRKYGVGCIDREDPVTKYWTIAWP